jgi:hypothetical protein
MERLNVAMVMCLTNTLIPKVNGVQDTNVMFASKVVSIKMAITTASKAATSTLALSVLRRIDLCLTK